MYCGIKSLEYILRYYNMEFDEGLLYSECLTSPNGVSLEALSNLAEKFGLSSLPVALTFKKLATLAPLPCILFWTNNHYVVLKKIEKNEIFIVEPLIGIIPTTKDFFLRCWLTQKNKGIALLVLNKQEKK